MDELHIANGHSLHRKVIRKLSAPAWLRRQRGIDRRRSRLIARLTKASKPKRKISGPPLLKRQYNRAAIKKSIVRQMEICAQARARKTRTATA